jgi:uncharacterized protein (DUF488 family)
MKLYTIGFTQTTAEHFFQRLIDAEVGTLIDTRLNRDGQLAGFAKAQDLRFFLDRLASIKYVAEPLLAPTAETLRSYRDKKMSWAQYADAYNELLRSRGVEKIMLSDKLDGSCLLCSEPKAVHCHRRLAAEYLQKAHDGIERLEIVHL